MAIKEKTKINRARIRYLVLCCIVLSFSSKVLGTHIRKTSEKYTLRRRKNVSLANKSTPPIAMHKQEQNNEIRRKVVEEVIVQYGLDQYRSAIYKVKELKERDYSSYDDPEIMSFVSFQVCRCLFILSVEYFNKKKYKESRAAFNKGKEMLAANTEDKNFDVFNKYQPQIEALIPHQEQ